MGIASVFPTTEPAKGQMLPASDGIPPPIPEKDGLTLPLNAEEISVSRRERRNTVRVSTVTLEQERQIDEELSHERIEIERVPIGRQVDAVPPVRQEDNTTIMPVIEEIVVVERRLILKEEVRIRRVRVIGHHRETVVVREQDFVVTRTEAGMPAIQEDHRPLESNPMNLPQEQLT